MLKNIFWFGHASFFVHVVTSKIKIYIDPWQLPDNLPVADIVFVSHFHYDHCSPNDIQKIAGPGTIVVGNEATVNKVTEVGSNKTLTVQPNENYEVAGISFKTVRAYNVNKYRKPGLHFHPKEEDHLGFVIKADDQYIYFSGDTDVIPEEVIYGPKIDLAIIPVSGSYVMSKEEAVEEINKLKPKLAVPMHYGRLVGSYEDAEYFARKAGVAVSIMTETKKSTLFS